MKMIDHLYSYNTYFGCLEGCQPIDKVYEDILKTVSKLWGMRKTHFIKPTLHNDMLPSWTHIAWVNDPAMDRENHGSELVVIWFSDELATDVYDIIEQVDWNSHAEDFQY